MATSPPSRIATLPGFDTSPDVYETHNNDDSTTTTTTTTSNTETTSPRSDTSDTSEDEESYGVSRRRLYPERARHRFGQDARSIKIRGADLSDRVDGRRRGFRRAKHEDESLQEKIARLRKEVEECRVLAERERRGPEGGEGGDMEELGRLLAGLPTLPKSRRKAEKDDDDDFHDATENGEDEGEEEEEEEAEGRPSSAQPLLKVSDFDTRLSALEDALGLSSLDTETETAAPLLPTLLLLDQQLATLNSATSLTALESASSRIAALKTAAADLHTLQTTQSRLQTDAAADDDDDDDDGGGHENPLLSPADMTRIQALYTLLPTLQTLAPTVPALITRLRSLRTLHTTAASASADLDSVEQRQAEMDGELKMWREGLSKVEEAVKDADAANGRNGAYVRGWVGDLEKRMEALGG